MKRDVVGRSRAKTFLLPLWRLKMRLRAAWTAKAGFTFAGQHYAFLFRSYNYTWGNERQVEVPIVQAEIAGMPPGQVLEVGNVLGHYVRRHAVIDKYEAASGVQGWGSGTRTDISLPRRPGWPKRAATIGKARRVKMLPV